MVHAGFVFQLVPNDMMLLHTVVESSVAHCLSEDERTADANIPRDLPSTSEMVLEPTTSPKQ
jgi:hypothetical protein